MVRRETKQDRRAKRTKGAHFEAPYTRTLAEEAVRKTEAQYQTLFDSMDEGFCRIEVIFDENKKPLDYRFLEVNAAFERQTGIKNAKGRLMREIAPAHEQHWFDIYGKIALTGESARFENRAEALSRSYDVYAFRVGLPEHRQVGIIFNDITQRKKTEEELKYRTAILESQQEVTPFGILVVSPEGKIISHNQYFAHMWRLPKGILDTERDEAALHAVKEQLTDPDGFLQKVAELYKIRKNSREKLHFKDGRVFDRYASPIVGSDGTYYGYVWFFLDITEQERLVKQKDEFLGIASHELKTPVTSIKAYAEVLELRFSKEDDIKSAELVGKMNRQLDKLTHLIGDLLDATKIEGGKLQFNKGLFDFNELVQEMAEEMQRTTAAHSIIKKLVPIKALYGDRDRIGQVIANLLSNAIKYSPHAEKINVKSAVDKDKAMVTLCVQDFGLGLKAKDQEKIFERFYRAEGSGRETYPGLGLGLYISSEIIRRHGGRIWVKAKKGKGSTFCFSLPLKKPRKE